MYKRSEILKGHKQRANESHWLKLIIEDITDV